MKAKFDYGLVIFMLTYALILVSGFKISLSEDTRLAWERLFVILMASIICLVICIGIFPAWAGTDLHNLIASTFDDLSLAVEGIKHYISNYQVTNLFGSRNVAVFLFMLIIFQFTCLLDWEEILQKQLRLIDDFLQVVRMSIREDL